MEEIDKLDTDPVIIQFDEDDSYFMVLDMICYNMGLEITAYANNIEKTRDIIRQIESKKTTPTIAVIGNYLGNDFFDGEKLAVKLRAISPGIKIISFVTDPETEWGDYLAIKSGQDQSKSILSILESITGKKFTPSNLEK